jgi:hypothetical protein
MNGSDRRYYLLLPLFYYLLKWVTYLLNYLICRNIYRTPTDITFQKCLVISPKYGLKIKLKKALQHIPSH